MLIAPASGGDARVEGSGCTVRLATARDAAALARAAAAFFRDTFGAANRSEDMDAYVPAAFSEERQAAELSAPDARIWLAVDPTDAIAGYVHLRLGAAVPAAASLSCDRPAEIARLYADRRWHGHGLGPRLMAAAVSTAREWGADVLWLGVWQQNARAIAFYEKQGFVVVGAQDFLLGADRQRDHVMALRLTSNG
jgi:GNAT superfamily N-acetyltransferase